jgi:hypothetical protein
MLTFLSYKPQPFSQSLFHYISASSFLQR